MTRRAASGRAAGKVILFGEHAVVWGTHALACALPEGMVAEAAEGTGPLCVFVPAWDLCFSIDDDDAVHTTALQALVRSLSVTEEAVQVTVRTALIPRAGLGASAAMAASIARALSAYCGVDRSFDALFAAVQASEKVFHGNPSGLDATVALKAETVIYSKADGGTHVDVPPPPLLIVYSGAPGDTRRTVSRFTEQMARAPTRSEHRIRQISDIVDSGLKALCSGDLRVVGELMVENHRLLQWFGVSTPDLDRIVDLSLESGALGAKLTGGGGGGCAIVLPGENRAEIQQVLTNQGYKVIAE